MEDTITITKKSYMDLMMVSLTALARLGYYAQSEEQIADYEIIEEKMTNAITAISDQIGD
jgi:hypothetical protein